MICSIVIFIVHIGTIGNDLLTENQNLY